MMHDVVHILGVPVEGSPVVGCDELKTRSSGVILDLFGADARSALGPASTWQKSGVKTSAIYERMTHTLDDDWTHATLWLWATLACTLFMDKSRDRAVPDLPYYLCHDSEGRPLQLQRHCGDMSGAPPSGSH